VSNPNAARLAANGERGLENARLLHAPARAAASRSQGGPSLVRATAVPRLPVGAIYDKGSPSNHPAVTTISLATTLLARARRAWRERERRAEFFRR